MGNANIISLCFLTGSLHGWITSLKKFHGEQGQEGERQLVLQFFSCTIFKKIYFNINKIPSRSHTSNFVVCSPTTTIKASVSDSDCEKPSPEATRNVESSFRWPIKTVMRVFPPPCWSRLISGIPSPVGGRKPGLLPPAARRCRRSSCPRPAPQLQGNGSNFTLLITANVRGASQRC